MNIPYPNDQNLQTWFSVRRRSCDWIPTAEEKQCSEQLSRVTRWILRLYEQHQKHPEQAHIPFLNLQEASVIEESGVFFCCLVYTELQGHLPPHKLSFRYGTALFHNTAVQAGLLLMHQARSILCEHLQPWALTPHPQDTPIVFLGDLIRSGEPFFDAYEPKQIRETLRGRIKRLRKCVRSIYGYIYKLCPNKQTWKEQLPPTSPWTQYAPTYLGYLLGCLQCVLLTYQAAYLLEHPPSSSVTSTNAETERFVPQELAHHGIRLVHMWELLSTCGPLLREVVVPPVYPSTTEKTSLAEKEPAEPPVTPPLRNTSSPAVPIQRPPPPISYLSAEPRKKHRPSEALPLPSLSRLPYRTTPTVPQTPNTPSQEKPKPQPIPHWIPTKETKDQQIWETLYAFCLPLLIHGWRQLSQKHLKEHHLREAERAHHQLSLHSQVWKYNETTYEPPTFWNVWKRPSVIPCKDPSSRGWLCSEDGLAYPGTLFGPLTHKICYSALQQSFLGSDRLSKVCVGGELCLYRTALDLVHRTTLPADEEGIIPVSAWTCSDSGSGKWPFSTTALKTLLHYLEERQGYQYNRLNELIEFTQAAPLTVPTKSLVDAERWLFHGFQSSGPGWFEVYTIEDPLCSLKKGDAFMELKMYANPGKKT